MSASGGMFNGNCNLLSTCDYTLDGDGDFWSSFTTFAGQEMLFITGDGSTWASGNYAAIEAIVTAAAGVFTPNISWTDAGLGGTSLGGGIVGNILTRPGVLEDPWVTFQGSHCESGCSQILWGENNFIGSHTLLSSTSQGVQVYVTNIAAVPLPAGGLLLLTGLLGVAGLQRRKKRAA